MPGILKVKCGLSAAAAHLAGFERGGGTQAAAGISGGGFEWETPASPVRSERVRVSLLIKLA